MYKINKKIFLTLGFLGLLSIGKVTLSTTGMGDLGGLWAAIENIDIAEIKTLLKDKNLNINEIEDSIGYTPLSYACSLMGNNSDENNKLLNIIRLLLENGADKSINVAYNVVNSPLSLCYDNPELAKLLLEFGANIDEKSLNIAKNLQKQLNETELLDLLNLADKFDKKNNKQKLAMIDGQKDKSLKNMLIKRLFHKFNIDYVLEKAWPAKKLEPKKEKLSDITIKTKN